MSGDQLTLLPEESLASHLVRPGSNSAQQMTAISGRKLLEFLPSCDRKLWWLKTLAASSVWRSTMCLLTWKHKVTPRGRSYYQLQVSVPRTGEIAYGLWPTPRVVDVPRGPQAQGGESLTEAVHSMLPTPNAANAGNDLTLTCSGDGRTTPNKLGWAVAQMLPTPRSRDHHAESEQAAFNREGVWGTSLPSAGREPGLKLNPAWVSRMMGLPDGYLDLD